MFEHVEDILQGITTDTFALFDEAAHFVLGKLNLFQAHLKHVLVIGFGVLIR